MAREGHKSTEADLNEVHSLLQIGASRQDGPAAPVVFRAADLIIEASIRITVRNDFRLHTSSYFLVLLLGFSFKDSLLLILIISVIP